MSTLGAVLGIATPKAVKIDLTEVEAAELASRLRRRKVARADAMLGEIVLLAAQGATNRAIAERLGKLGISADACPLRSARITSKPLIVA